MFCRYSTIFLVLLCSATFAAGGSPDYNEYETRIDKFDERARYEEAISLSDEFTSAMFEQGGAGLPFAHAISLNAYLLLTLGRLHQATALFEQAFAIYRKNVQTSEPAFARALGNLGVAYQQGGRQASACVLTQLCLLVSATFERQALLILVECGQRRSSGHWRAEIDPCANAVTDIHRPQSIANKNHPKDQKRRASQADRVYAVLRNIKKTKMIERQGSKHLAHDD